MSTTAPKITERDVTRLLDLMQILSSGMSGMLGTYFVPGRNWSANVETGEITYDLGLAAVLDRAQRVAVAVHEIAHLRFTEPWQWPAHVGGMRRRMAHHLVNIIEDRRVEKLMIRDFPGYEGSIDSLHAALFAQAVQAAIEAAPLHLQFCDGVWKIVYGQPLDGLDAKVVAVLEPFRDEIIALSTAKTVKRVARAVIRKDDGLLAAAMSLFDQHGSQEAAEKLAGMTAGDMPSDADLAALPAGMRELLDDIAKSLGNGDGIELGDAMKDSDDRIDAVRQKALEMQQASEGGPDDAKLGRDGQRYDELHAQSRGAASVLARSLNQILLENRLNRFSAVPYRSGGRLHVPALTRSALSDESRVFRRRERNRNRQYAFSLLCDVSGSMRNRMGDAALALVTCSAAIDEVEGCDIAVYSFDNETLLLKPFGVDLGMRAGELGAVEQLCRGGGTGMARAIRRATEDMTDRYDDSWQRVMIVLTDGAPSDQPHELIRRASVEHGIDMYGIGIGQETQRSMRELFPNHAIVSSASAIAPATIKMMRKAVKHG